MRGDGVSETDSFIREVTEEVRQDELAQVWGRYRYLIIGGAAAAIAAVSVWSWRQHAAQQAALDVGTRLLAVAEGRPEEQAALADSLAGDAGVIADLQAAAALATGDVDAAVARYRALAARPGLAAAYADLALLSALRLDAARIERAAFQAQIAPLTAEGRPYRPLALELRASLALNAGDAAAAIVDLDAILAEPSATAATQARAAALKATISAETPR